MKTAFGRPWPDVINSPRAEREGSSGFRNKGLDPHRVKPWHGLRELVREHAANVADTEAKLIVPTSFPFDGADRSHYICVWSSTMLMLHMRSPQIPVWDYKGSAERCSSSSIMRLQPHTCVPLHSGPSVYQ